MASFTGPIKPKPTNGEPLARENRKDALTAIAYVTGSVLLAIVGFEFNRIHNSLEDVIEREFQNRVAINANTSYRQQHGDVGDAKRYVAIIDRLVDRVHKLETDSAARKDPYTGTQALVADAKYRAIMAAMHRRIANMEHVLVEKKIIQPVPDNPYRFMPSSLMRDDENALALDQRDDENALALDQLDNVLWDFALDNLVN